ncbi:recombinase RecF, partial [Acinetobacter baumannii]
SNRMCINGDDIKGWFVKRFLYSKHEDTLTNIQQKNLNLAVSSFSILDKNFKFKKISLNHEIIINTPTGDLFFERLSSGYKSIIYIILGLIKEIDYRLAAKGKCAAEFNGIILIDEIETHLHPVWQGKICIVLKEIFPKAQFFVTTHSPHVVQTANRNEVISLTRSDNNEVQVRDLPEAEYGYQGWTIEEILKDVMGMPDLRTKKYDEVKRRFDNALDNQNINEAREAYNELDMMLHPRYPLRPVFRMQLDSLGE